MGEVSAIATVMLSYSSLHSSKALESSAARTSQVVEIDKVKKPNTDMISLYHVKISFFMHTLTLNCCYTGNVDSISLQCCYSMLHCRILCHIDKMST